MGGVCQERMRLAEDFHFKTDPFAFRAFPHGFGYALDGFRQGHPTLHVRRIGYVCQLLERIENPGYLSGGNETLFYGFVVS